MVVPLVLFATLDRVLISVIVGTLVLVLIILIGVAVFDTGPRGDNARKVLRMILSRRTGGGDG